VSEVTENTAILCYCDQTKHFTLQHYFMLYRSSLLQTEKIFIYKI